MLQVGGMTCFNTTDHLAVDPATGGEGADNACRNEDLSYTPSSH